ncbi:MAG: ABC transporter ATP-binding protein [Bacteroidales bacterium]
MNNKLIEIKDLSAGYEGRIVLRDVNLEINELDFMGIIGPNGGGKTTLIKTILGLIEPYKGEILFFDHGKKVDEIVMGYLPQRNNIDHHFPITVEEVVLSGLMGSERSLLGRPSRADRERVAEVLQMTGMYEKRKSSIGALSGGQMQRVMLGRAIVNHPKLLVLDEPNSYIDKRFEERLYELLREINKTTTILMVSHEVTSLVDMVTRTICVDETIKPADLTCPFHHG